MFDFLLNAIKLDEFLIALAGHFANEASAKLTITAVKALGLAVLGFAVEAREASTVPKATVVRRRKRATRQPVKGAKALRRGRR